MERLRVLISALLAGAGAAFVVTLLAYGQGLAIPPLFGHAGSNAFWAEIMGALAFAVVFVSVLRSGGEWNVDSYGE